MRTVVWAIMLVGFLAAPAHAAVYWDDEMQVFNGTGHGSGGATTGGFNPLPNAPEPCCLPSQGTQPMTMDTAVKFSGTGSLRYNYTARCQITDGSAGPQPCGGSTSRNFPYADEHYGRVYMRVSANFDWADANGQTKIFGVRSTQGLSKLWFNFYFGLGMIVSAENTPTNGDTQNIFINFTMPREQWVCFEWRIKANNPPGTANGILQTWATLPGATGPTQTVSRADITWRGPGNNSYLDFIHPYRQNGFGNLWFDRFAVGNTRIGCVVPGDTTPPSIPGSFTVQ